MSAKVERYFDAKIFLKGVEVRPNTCVTYNLILASKRESNLNSGDLKAWPITKIGNSTHASKGLG